MYFISDKLLSSMDMYKKENTFGCDRSLLLVDFYNKAYSPLGIDSYIFIVC